MDAQARGAFLAVDEDASRHGWFPLGDRQHKARRAFLRARLPEHMVPAVLVPLAALPLAPFALAADVPANP